MDTLRKKERYDETQFATKVDGFWSLTSCWMLMYFFVAFFESHPVYDQTQGSGAVFSFLYRVITLLVLSGKSCPVGPELDPSFDASSPPGCCLQSHEILLNKGMKYWDSGLNAPGSRTSITTVHIAAAVIGWRSSGKERTGQTQFSTKFAAKLSFMPRWSPVYFFFPCFSKSHPLCDQTGRFGAVFSWIHG